MRGNHWGAIYGVTSFGESHGKALGVVIEDVKPNLPFPYEELSAALAKRKPGSGEFQSTRKEPDSYEIISGVFNERTTGMPICILFPNVDANSANYSAISELFKPGHADFSWFSKYKIFDYRGSGRASGRETISRVAAGAILQSVLPTLDYQYSTLQIGSHKAIGENTDFQNPYYWHDETSYSALLNYLKDIKEAGDSIGGLLQVQISGVPVGWGDPVFEKLDANIAKAMLSIGAVKGILFGSAMDFIEKPGSIMNDEMNSKGFLSNHHGGILGGVSTGEDIVFQIIVKPVPSIGIEQDTISYDGTEKKIQISGRHDTCIIPRLIPVVESMLTLVFADASAYQKLLSNQEITLNDYREALDKIDNEILSSIYRRIQIVKQVKIYKKEHGLPATDEEREKQILENTVQEAIELGLPTEQVSQIIAAIIRLGKTC